MHDELLFIERIGIPSMAILIHDAGQRIRYGNRENPHAVSSGRE
jgi:hypothetical protein